MKRIITEEPALRDLRHLANELATLLRAKQDPAELVANRQQATELAETAWHRLRTCGPVKTEELGYTLCFRALEAHQVECLGWDEVEGSSQRRHANVLLLDTWWLWLHLQTVEQCPEKLYADVLQLTVLAEQRPPLTLIRAERRWDECEQALRAEGLLPVRVLAPPCAAGGARYVTEVYVGGDQLPALRETLAYWGGFLIAQRPFIGSLGPESASRFCTLSLESVDDLWRVASMMVFQFYADRADLSDG